MNQQDKQELKMIIESEIENIQTALKAIKKDSSLESIDHKCSSSFILTNIPFGIN